MQELNVLSYQSELGTIKSNLDEFAQHYYNICRSDRLPSNQVNKLGIAALSGYALTLTTFCVIPSFTVTVATGVALGVIAYYIYQFYLDRMAKENFIDYFKNASEYNYGEAWSSLKQKLEIDKNCLNNFLEVHPYRKNGLNSETIIFYTALMDACCKYEKKPDANDAIRLASPLQEYGVNRIVHVHDVLRTINLIKVSEVVKLKGATQLLDTKNFKFS